MSVCLDGSGSDLSLPSSEFNSELGVSVWFFYLGAKERGRDFRDFSSHMDREVSKWMHGLLQIRIHLFRATRVAIRSTDRQTLIHLENFWSPGNNRECKMFSHTFAK